MTAQGPKPTRLRATACGCALAGGLAVAAAPGTARADEDIPWMATRSRLYFFLDPEARALDPYAPSAVGTFSLAAGQGDLRAEASGWVGHGPVGPMETTDPVSGDVRTLVLRYGNRNAWAQGGRMLTAIGTTDMDTLDGIAGGLRLGTFDAALVAARQGPDPRALLGDGWVFGGDFNNQFTEAVRAGIGARHRRFDDANGETQLTARVGYYPSETWDVAGRAKAAIENPALVEARIDASARPIEPLALGVFAVRADLRAQLPPNDILSVFATDNRNEAGVRADYTFDPAVVGRLDVSGIKSADRTLAGSGRAGVDWRPRTGATIVTEGEQRYDVSEMRSTVRSHARWPLTASTAGTVEVVADRAQSSTQVRWNGAGRVGLSVTPFQDWSFYGALESGLGDAFPDGRVGGLLLVEYAAGAPVRWGGLP